MEKLLLSFLKPPFRSYNPSDLGPNIFEINQMLVKRSDHQVEKIPFSYYQIAEHRPLVLYLHSYNSNRLEPNQLMQLLLQEQFNVASLDLQRVAFNPELKKMEVDPEGLISFGFYECQQVEPVVRWLRKRSRAKLYLWGRSMGGVTALLFQSKYGGADGLILDSPFHSLYEIFVSQFVNLTGLPRFLGKSSALIINLSFRSLLRFQIRQMDILERFNIKCPTFIIVNPKDCLAGESGKLIYSHCRGIRKILYSEAEHSASRELSVLTEIIAHLDGMERPSKQYCIRSSYGFEDYPTSKTEQNEIQVKRKRKKQLYLTLVKSQKKL